MLSSMFKYANCQQLSRLRVTYLRTCPEGSGTFGEMGMVDGGVAAVIVEGLPTIGLSTVFL